MEQLRARKRRGRAGGLVTSTEFGLEAESEEDLGSQQVLEYGRRPCAIIDEEEVPDSEEEVVTKEPGVRHAEGVAKPAIEEFVF